MSISPVTGRIATGAIHGIAATTAMVGTGSGTSATTTGMTIATGTMTGMTTAMTGRIEDAKVSSRRFSLDHSMVERCAM